MERGRWKLERLRVLRKEDQHKGAGSGEHRRHGGRCTRLWWPASNTQQRAIVCVAGCMVAGYRFGAPCIGFSNRPHTYQLVGSRPRRRWIMRNVLASSTGVRLGQEHELWAAALQVRVAPSTFLLVHLCSKSGAVGVGVQQAAC